MSEKVSKNKILDKSFIIACMNGNIEKVKLLLSFEGDRKIDVHSDYEGGFRNACLYSKLEIVELLLKLEGDRKIDVDTIDGDYNNELVDLVLKYRTYKELSDEFLMMRIKSLEKPDDKFHYLSRDDIIIYILKLRSYKDLSKESFPVIAELLNRNSVLTLQLIWNKQIPACNFYLNEKEERILEMCRLCAWKWYEKWISEKYKPGSYKMIEEMNIALNFKVKL